MLRICPLFSGSSGNSTYIRSAESTLLIDAGVSGKRIQAAMSLIGSDCAEIDAVLLTHEHIDHMAGIGVIIRRYRLPLYLSRITWEAIQDLPIGDIPEGSLHLFAPGDSFCIGDVSVKTFSVPHDAADSVGFRISGSASSVSFFTDIGEMKSEVLSEVAGSNAVFIESNYDREMLFGGPYPWPLKRRIDGNRGHLSNADCAKTAKALLGTGTQYFVLSHLSAENNTPAIAYETTAGHLASEGAVQGKDYKLQVAPRFSPGEPWLI